MNPHATIDVEMNPPPAAGSGGPQGHAQPARVAEKWLSDHLEILALLVTSAAFVVRIAFASGTYLNPDEALQYGQINQPSVFLAYKMGQSLPHPPLYYLLLYFWHLLGRSELMLRLPSVILGTALCWLTFKWIGALFGKAAGLVGLILVAFCPALIALSGEVRQYALLVFCMVAALVFVERAFQHKSVRDMWCFSAFLYLAILSHYSAFCFVVSAGLYCLMRIADSQLTRKVAAAWGMGQIGAVAIYAFLYVTHLSKLKANLSTWGGELDQSYFHSYRDDIFVFSGHQTLEIFRYWFAKSYVSAAMLAIFLAGVALLFSRDMVSRPRKPSSRLVILLFVPFVALWGAAIANVYPYVPSRHTVLLAPFAMAASSFLLATLSRQKLWASLLIAATLVAVANASAKPIEPGFTREDQRRALMIAAVDHVHQFIPRSDLILVDYQTSLPLTYYLCGPKRIVPLDTSRPDFFQFNCDGYSVVSVRFWKLRYDGLTLPFAKMVHSYGLKPGDQVWVFQAGWGGNLVAELPQHFSQFRCLVPLIFGDNISIVPMRVGPDLSPVPQTNCHN
jgi:hypothetical protein